MSPIVTLEKCASREGTSWKSTALKRATCTTSTSNYLKMPSKNIAVQNNKQHLKKKRIGDTLQDLIPIFKSWNHLALANKHTVPQERFA